MATEPDWLTRARNYIGVREVPGKGDAPIIQQWLRRLGAWWSDDATPWCGTFVATVMRDSGYAIPKHWYRAKAWLDWGLELESPRVGCIVVYERTGGGHVGFILGKDRDYRLLTLGGNQADSVNVMAFHQSRAAGYRWPKEAPPPLTRDPLPIIRQPAAVSTSEA